MTSPPSCRCSTDRPSPLRADAEVLSAEAGQLLLTGRQQEQRMRTCAWPSAGKGPAPTGPQVSAQAAPDRRNGPRRVLARAGLQPHSSPGGAPPPAGAIAHSAPSWRALSGERRPGAGHPPPGAQHPQPHLGSSVPAHAQLLFLPPWGLACPFTPRPRGLSSREVFEHLEMQPRWEGGAS